MDFTTAVKTVFSKYVDFSGRAPRAEFWWFYLFVTVIDVALQILAAIGQQSQGFSMLIGVLLVVFGLAVLLPNLAVSVRRLHDIDRSGWWLLISIVPLVGIIVLIVFWCSKSTDGANRFGPNPYGQDQRIVETFS